MAAPKQYRKSKFSLGRLNFPSWLLLFSLCVLSYFFGIWQHSKGITLGHFASTASAIANSLAIPCTATTSEINALPKETTTSEEEGIAASVDKTKKLDFSSHHLADNSGGPQEEKTKDFPVCDTKFSEYTPCEDEERSLKFPRTNLIYRERHCPVKNELLKCLIPAPYGYTTPFKWPTRRDFAWYANVPHRHLTVEKANQNWIQFKGDRFKFPGGGTMFPNGADAYIDDIGQLINLKNGSIRTAIDTGCGVASWGAYLLSRNILAVSFAPRDTHEAQVQFALERGVPALIGVLASIRLPYPSRAFDMAHCSRCLIPWASLGGMYLMEVDRVLRPGGFWILSGPPIRWKKYSKGWERTEDDLNAEQTAIEKMAEKLCWKKFVEKDDIAIWRKPVNHVSCKAKNDNEAASFCPLEDDPDKAWYQKLKTCLTPLPVVSSNAEVAGGKLKKWPMRLNTVPPRISRGTVDGVTSETFQNDGKLWSKRITYYKSVNTQLGSGSYRNILDMNAFLGGFAATLKDDPVWVMNVVPVQAKVDTLGAIFERGLIGTYQNWCEAMSTYPRTYDFIHAEGVFTLYKDRCEAEDILLEMDRILRPEGAVIIRDDVDVLVMIKRIADGMKWESQVIDHEDGPLERQKLLFAVKSYWTAPKQEEADA